MGLTTYRKKRSFSKTPEPTGGKGTGKELRFVIQKHAASHLHYDFRLEMDGVLKSWAVPKGPSTDPEVKHLAMMVEDHPYDYRTFEGIIPKGEYGGGTVMVWDEGTYEPAETDEKDIKKQEKELLRQLRAGRLKFILHGKKLKGIWNLVRTNWETNSWLLIKHEDKYASTKDVLKKDKSVVSGLSLDKIAKTSENIYHSNRAEKARKTATKTSGKKKKAKEPIEETATDIDIETLTKKGKRAAFPRFFKPMLATLVDKPFDNEEWIYEIKWDGYRALSFINKSKVETYSRNGLSFNKKFPAVADALKEWGIKAVVDGEIIAVDENGNADFQQLQGFVKNQEEARLIYYLFDLIWYDGKDLSGLPLTERKAILESIIPQDDPVIKYSGHIEGQGTAFFQAATKKGLEGIIAKEADSIYDKGRRTQSWLKVKHNQRLEAVICGFTKPRNTRKHFGAIILGKYEGKSLKYIGHTGGGFDDESLEYLYNIFEKLITSKCPFKTVPKTNMPATWLKPELVCEVKFSEKTKDGILRQPVFIGLREDKNAATEKNEKVVHPPKASTAGNKKTTVAKRKTPAKKAASARSGNTLLQEDTKEETLKVNGKELQFTNLDKTYWPKEKITKRELLNYYAAIAPYILPYMKDRPQSLFRQPNGISKPGFFQKDVKGKVDEWIETFPYISESDGEEKEFLVCKNEASLLYMANLGCIEMNPWHSRIQKPESPDWCVIDLDPGKSNTFDDVIAIAQVVRQVLDSIGVPSYPKTSGATGIHIYIPFGARYDYDQSRMFAELVVNAVHREIPDMTSIERSPSKRGGRLYLDFLQNRKIQTISAPYSLRPKPGAPVSTPLHWDEVKKGLKVTDFTIYNILERIQSEGDIFEPVLGKGIALKQALAQYNKLFSED